MASGITTTVSGRGRLTAGTKVSSPNWSRRSQIPLKGGVGPVSSIAVSGGPSRRGRGRYGPFLSALRTTGGTNGKGAQIGGIRGSAASRTRSRLALCAVSAVCPNGRASGPNPGMAGSGAILTSMSGGRGPGCRATAGRNSSAGLFARRRDAATSSARRITVRFRAVYGASGGQHCRSASSTSAPHLPVWSLCWGSPNVSHSIGITIGYVK